MDKFLLPCLILVLCHVLSAQPYDPAVNTPVSELAMTPIEKEWSRNQCFKKVCQRGETCVLDRNKQAKCVCMSDCGIWNFHKGRFEVCSSNNITYQSECHLDKDHCLCKNNAKGCRIPGVKKVQMDYYGACRELPPCTKQQAVQFPNRLREWFFVIMDIMVKQSTASDYKDMWEEVVRGDNHNYATIWKFCDLDVDPQDRQVSKKELQFLTRALKANEQCFAPFLDRCDVNNDREITLREWGRCLGLKDNEIVDKCHSIRKYGKQI